MATDLSGPGDLSLGLFLMALSGEANLIDNLMSAQVNQNMRE
jgi:hypothetical protein